jgi:FkbM family methyltransferase
VVVRISTTSKDRPRSLAKEVEYVVRQVFANPGNKGERLRRTAEALIFPAWTRLTGGYWTTTYAGGQIVVRRGQGASHTVYARLPDYPEMSFWLASLRPGDLFVDVGANIGIYTLLIASHGCDVVSVEPAREARRLLEVNLGLNGLKADIIAAALGRAPGQGTLTDELGSMNYLVIDASESGTTGEPITPVTVTTLDDVLGDRNAAGVKIDVEGFELDVVLGASRALGEQRVGVLQLEWNSMARERFGRGRDGIGRTLQEAGYVLARPDARGRLRRTEAHEGADVFAVAPRLRDQLIVGDT